MKPWILFNLLMILALGYSTVFGSHMYLLTICGCLISSIGLIIIILLDLLEYAPLVLYF
jgi:hypothetical protein